jgi:hypothetical protein
MHILSFTILLNYVVAVTADTAMNIWEAWVKNSGSQNGCSQGGGASPVGIQILWISHSIV